MLAQREKRDGRRALAAGLLRESTDEEVKKRGPFPLGSGGLAHRRRKGLGKRGGEGDEERLCCTWNSLTRALSVFYWPAGGRASVLEENLNFTVSHGSRCLTSPVSDSVNRASPSCFHSSFAGRRRLSFRCFHPRTSASAPRE